MSDSSTYSAPVAEMLAIMRHCGGLGTDADAEAVPALLDAAGNFAAGRLAPLNRVGDRQGARWRDGIVTMPDGFPAAYADWIAGGWNAVSAPEAFGGAGLPCIVSTALMEMWASANMAFSMAPTLTQGAVEVLLAHADPALRAAWLPRLVSGEWAASMALTEPQAGSDLSLLRTRAEPAADGMFRVRGQKIFISYGEHDLTDNIVHLVLARLPDAPAGTRGISLFLVPKIMPDGTRNDLRCTGVEHKLGIHASPTCAMSFGDGPGALGWIVGAPNAGLAAMFTLMNRARLQTGLQGVALAEVACQQAEAYAAARFQGRDAAGQPAAIAAHPDVRRMLRAMRAATLAGRAIAYATAAAIDTAEREHSPEGAARAALLTPIAKAVAGDVGFEVASLNLQIHGGMGFVEETGAAQLLRDARIIPIYEGTTGIQAIDFATRKLQRDGGAAARAEMSTWRADAEAARDANDPALAASGRAVLAAMEPTETAIGWTLDAKRDPQAVLASATSLLHLFGLTAGGALLLRAALGAARADDAAAPALVRAAAFYAAHKLPFAAGLAACVTEGADAVLAA